MPGPRLHLSRAGGLILCACDRIRTTERVDSDDQQSFSLMRDDASHSDLGATDLIPLLSGLSLSVNCKGIARCLSIAISRHQGWHNESMFNQNITN